MASRPSTLKELGLGRIIVIMRERSLVNLDLAACFSTGTAVGRFQLCPSFLSATHL